MSYTMPESRRLTVETMRKSFARAESRAVRKGRKEIGAGEPTASTYYSFVLDNGVRVLFHVEPWGSHVHRAIYFRGNEDMAQPDMLAHACYAK